MKIRNIQAREILDSRGNPTVAATVELNDGSFAEASVPSGASTGSHEKLELRDGQKDRYQGLGELKAVSNINEIISPALRSLDAANQSEIDQAMKGLDGTANKSNLGANAILAVSLAVARAEALSCGQELFERVAELHGSKKKLRLPIPMFNILNGGKHASNNLDFQETMVVPFGLKTFERRLRAGAEIYHVLRNQLINEGLSVGLGDEGGFAPELTDNETTLKVVERAISEAGYSKDQIAISLDVAATEFFDKNYELKAEKKSLSSKQMIKRLIDLAKKYGLLSIEDGLAENDPEWPALTKGLGSTLSIGDDLFTTDPKRISEGVKTLKANGVIIKPNQIGTLTETLEAIALAQKAGWKVIVSHRSGETEDSFIADLAVGVGADFIKSGAPARSERLAKYNRLCQIEDILSSLV